MTHTHKIPQQSALVFMLAGNATFTLKSLVSNNHYTYKITSPKENSRETTNTLWVSLMTGTSNESDFTYMCYLHIKKGVPQLRISKKARITPEAAGFKAFAFVLENLVKGRLMNKLEIWHEGKCCRCGRKLTTPESIANGIGPECAGIKAKFEIEQKSLRQAHELV